MNCLPCMLTDLLSHHAIYVRWTHRLLCPTTKTARLLSWWHCLVCSMLLAVLVMCVGLPSLLTVPSVSPLATSTSPLAMCCWVLLWTVCLWSLIWFTHCCVADRTADYKAGHVPGDEGEWFPEEEGHHVRRGDHPCFVHLRQSHRGEASDAAEVSIGDWAGGFHVTATGRHGGRGGDDDDGLCRHRRHSACDSPWVPACWQQNLMCQCDWFPRQPCSGCCWVSTDAWGWSERRLICLWKVDELVTFGACV